MTSELQITQTRSLIGSNDGHRRTLRALGLRRRHHVVTQPDRPEIRGMLSKVAHLVEVSYVGEDDQLDLEPGQEPKGEGNPPAGQSVADEESSEIAEGIEEAVAVAETGKEAVAAKPPVQEVDSATAEGESAEDTEPTPSDEEERS